MTDILHKELSCDVVNAAIAVWSNLGYGFLERVYENALAIELKSRAIPVLQQQPIPVHYAGQVVGDYVADLGVDNRIILELKSAKTIDDAHLAQTLNYLKATGIRLGIILNFGPHKMDFKRVVL